MVDPVYSYLTRSIHVALMLSLTFVLPLSAAHAVSAGPADVSGGNLEASSGVDSIFADGFDPAVVPCEPVQLLEDSSFEATNPDDFTNPFWPSSSTNFGTPFCTLDLCGTGMDSSAPRTGTFWAWLGGTGNPETGHLEQTVSIPSGNPRHLNFWLRMGTLSGSGATVEVTVDSRILRTFVEPAQPEPAYVQYTVDVSDFADGQQHVVAFTYVSPGDISNYSLDDVTLECVASGQ